MKTKNRRHLRHKEKSLGKELWSWYLNKGPIFQFGLKFSLLVALFYLFSMAPFCQSTLYPAYLKANARASSVILNYFGQHCSVMGQTIQSPKFSIIVSQGCDAVESSWFLCAAIFAFPAPFTRKLPAVLIGIILLQPLNLARLVTLFLIGVYYPLLFETAHIEVWPVVFILVIISFWMGWLKWIKDRT